jgi:hypothetical protein
MSDKNKLNPSDFHQNNEAGSCLNDSEKRCLVEDVKALLTGGIGKIEITEKAWCTFIKISIEGYVKELQKWLVNNQWSSLNGKNLSKNDICFALTQRSFDYELQFSYAYSKQIGHQSRGNWELKKDFINLVNGQQVYEIPAGREINEVLWLTPSDINHATFAALGYGNAGSGTGANGGLSWGGAGGGFNMSNGAYYIAPAYDIMLRAADYGLKNRILQSDLTYKITAGANGTRLLHLLSVPNKSHIGVRDNLYKCKVWYHYYDTEDMTAEEKNKCLEECKDIIKYPSDVPMTKTDFCDLNEWSKTWVRELLTAYAKEALGRARGKFKGQLPFPDAEATMDYESLLAEGKEEKAELIKELREYLEELRSDKQLKRRAEEAEDINRLLSKNPNGFWVI